MLFSAIYTKRKTEANKNLGNCYYQKELPAKALNCYKGGIKQLLASSADENTEDLHENIEEILSGIAKTGKYYCSKSDFEATLSTFHDYVNISNLVFHETGFINKIETSNIFALMSTIMRIQGCDIEIAIECYESALSLNPDNSLAHQALGNCYLDKNMPEKAMSYFRDAIASFQEARVSNPAGFEDYEELANCYLKIGDIDNYNKYSSLAKVAVFLYHQPLFLSVPTLKFSLIG